MNWEIGVTTGVCTVRPIVEALEAAAEVGLLRVEIGTPPQHFDPLEPRAVEAAAAALTRLGLHAVSMHAPFGGARELSEPDARARDAAVSAMLGAAATLRRLGGTILVVHPSDVPRDRANPVERLQHTADALARVTDGCRALGIRVALETPLPHLIGGHPAEFARLLDAAGGDLGVCLDTGHAHLGHHLAGFLDVIGHRLLHVHVHDNHGKADDHLAPGEGSVNWEAVFSGLREARYQGCLMLELRCPHESLAGHFSSAERRLRDLVARYGPQGGGRSLG